MATTKSVGKGSDSMMPNELVVTHSRPVSEATSGTMVWRRWDSESVTSFRARVKLDVANLQLAYVVFHSAKDNLNGYISE